MRPSGAWCAARLYLHVEGIHSVGPGDGSCRPSASRLSVSLSRTPSRPRLGTLNLVATRLGRLLDMPDALVHDRPSVTRIRIPPRSA